MNVTLRQIEGFLAAADLLSFSRAAQKLHITQSAFSQLIREFESALDVRLFDRTTRAVSLTQAGRSLVETMRTGVAAIEEACHAARSIQQLDRGHVSLATLPSLAAGLVTQALGDLRRQLPGITVSLLETDNAELLRTVMRADVELAVCAEVPMQPSLAFELLYTEELVLVAPDGHPLSRRKRHRWSVLRDLPLILPTLHTSARQSISQALEDNGVELRPAFEIAGLTASVSMVRAGLGVTVMPLTALIEMNMQGVFVCQLFGPAVLRRIAICRRKDRSLSPAAQKIVQLLRVRVGEVVKSGVVQAGGISVKAADR